MMALDKQGLEAGDRPPVPLTRTGPERMRVRDLGLELFSTVRPMEESERFN